MMIRTVEEVFHARETMEGAGVRLHRAFGYHQIPRFDPFLMLDDFRGDKPGDYLKGFPWHPHRGLRLSPTCLKEWSSMETVWVTPEPSGPVQSSG
ncbi:pirin family protein [uncultured Methanospirillum sp.]|uniref:pirin family protein n=1 Tax=uncultured Methanospirillum sp. TaxID=262503 RepID=UPI0029C7DFD6|nr:pirin family protein [uncultured Methanospirillum sp.]